MVLQKPRERGAFFIFCPNTHELSCERLTPLAYNVGNMKCTGLKAVSYPDTQMIIKGSTVQFGTDTRIFYIVCYRQFLLRLWMN